MKFILLILLPLNLFSQNYQATLYFKDGTKKVGFADMIQNEPKIKFIEEGQSKKQKIEINDLDKITYIDDTSKKEVLFENKDVIYTKMNGKTENQNSWMTNIYSEKDITVYKYINNISGYISYGAGNSPRSVMKPSTDSWYFFQYKNQTPHTIYFDFPMVGKRKAVTAYLKEFFNEICPSITNDYHDDKIDMKEGAKALLDYYDAKCQKKTNTSF